MRSTAVGVTRAARVAVGAVEAPIEGKAVPADWLHALATRTVVVRTPIRRIRIQAAPYESNPRAEARACGISPSFADMKQRNGTLTRAMGRAELSLGRTMPRHRQGVKRDLSHYSIGARHLPARAVSRRMRRQHERPRPPDKLPGGAVRKWNRARSDRPRLFRARRLTAGHGSPTEVRLASGRRLIEPPDRRIMRRRMKKIRTGVSFFHDARHRLNERVERF